VSLLAKATVTRKRVRFASKLASTITFTLSTVHSLNHDPLQAASGIGAWVKHFLGQTR
jgi:hypothetical protein